MKVLLSKDVPLLGTMGQVVVVKDGYARNFLLPRGMCLLANDRNKSSLENIVKSLEKKKSKELGVAKSLAGQIEKTSVTVTKQVGEDERIFGTVTTAELEELLANEGIKISKKDISLVEEIKKVGVYTAHVKLHPEVLAKFKVWVVAQ